MLVDPAFPTFTSLFSFLGKLGRGEPLPCSRTSSLWLYGGPLMRSVVCFILIDLEREGGREAVPFRLCLQRL